MSKPEYTLAKLADVKYSKKFLREAREAASTDSDNLERKRLDFSKESLLLDGMVKEIQKLNNQKCVTPEESQIRDRKIAELHTLASLKGIAGLYHGLGLIADMLSVSMHDENKKTGEKIYWRVPVSEILYDVACYSENIEIILKKQRRILRDIGLAQKAFWKGKHDLDDDDGGDENPTGRGDEESIPLPVGVPEKDLIAAKQVSDEQIQAAIKG